MKKNKSKAKKKQPPMLVKDLQAILTYKNEIEDASNDIRRCLSETDKFAKEFYQLANKVLEITNKMDKLLAKRFGLASYDMTDDEGDCDE